MVGMSLENECLTGFCWSNAEIDACGSTGNLLIWKTLGVSFFLNEENPIQVSVDGLEGKDFSILLEGRNKVVEIETIDKNSGKYNVKALKKGNISLSVMGKVNKKIDLII